MLDDVKDKYPKVVGAVMKPSELVSEERVKMCSLD